jgi:NADP-dependent 3-hydroxy acid dehydrogenase YdfG
METIAQQVVLITGASRGIGKALALQLAAKKARLALVARNEAELNAVKNEAEALGASCISIAGSVADETVATVAVNATIAAYGSIDALVNNAGYGINRAFETLTEKEWDELYATNVKGTFLFSKAVAPHLKEKRSGHIVVVASDIAKRTYPTGALYCSSKYAQHAFADAIRKELRPFLVKVSTVYSGLVDSYFHPEPQGDAAHDWWLKNEDVARAITYILEQPAHVVVDELMIHPLQQDY